MNSQQRFLRRLKVIENIDLFLRESVYHRIHRADTATPQVHLWDWDAEEGESETTL